MGSAKNLVDHLIRTRVLKTPKIIEAFKKIDRADFVPEDQKHVAYEDYPIGIGFGQTISQPYTVAFMLELLRPQLGQKVLDIGSGSGWTTSLLAHLVGKTGRVIGVELLPELVSFSQQNLRKYNVPQAEIHHAKKSLGYPEEAPFDRILVSASATKPTDELLRQLSSHGKLVMPVKESIWLFEKSKNIKSFEYPGFVFVPLLSG
jgi:protein-L-isoaspartate(D-aspartate) O-methyltransferase